MTTEPATISTAPAMITTAPAIMTMPPAMPSTVVTQPVTSVSVTSKPDQQKCQRDIGKALIAIGVVLIFGSIICLKMNWIKLLYMLTILWLILFFIILILVIMSGADTAPLIFIVTGQREGPITLTVLNVILGIVFIGVGADMLVTTRSYDLKCI